MADDKTIPAAGDNYKVESSTKWVKKGHHDTGTPRNDGLPKPDKAYLRHKRDEDYVQPPEYTENTLPGTGFGGLTKIKVEVPASKRKNAVQSNPQGARPDTNPDWSHSRGIAGPVHPKSKPQTAKPGSGPRHPDHKPVTSVPDGGPRPSAGKDSSNANDTVSYGEGYGDRSPVTDPTVKNRSDVIAPDSSMVHPNNNPKKRDASSSGISREVLKTSKKLK